MNAEPLSCSPLHNKYPVQRYSGAKIVPVRNYSSDQEVSSDVSGIEGELVWPHLSSPEGYQSP